MLNLMKRKNNFDSIRSSETDQDNNNVDKISRKLIPENNYKRKNTQQEPLKLENSKKIIPPPGLPKKSAYKQSYNKEQRGRRKKLEWL